MNEIDFNNFNNSGSIFGYFLKNKNTLTLFLIDGTKLSGRLLGWDTDYIIILYGKTLQVVPVKNISRVQAELDNVSTPEAPAVTTTELPKPKITLAPEEGNDIKDQIMAEKSQNANNEKAVAQDRLDHLVKNW